MHNIKTKILLILQSILPHHFLSRLMHYLVNANYPPLKNYLIKKFIRRYDVAMQDALEPNPFAYKNFNAFFTRALRPTTRPVANQTIVSPADGCIYEQGTLTPNKELLVKNQSFDLNNLLGGENYRSNPFINGDYISFYLSPKDYHRVHIPYTGTLREMIYCPGYLFSVNPQTCANKPLLFSQNERVINIFTTDLGPMAVILVGAFFVGSIHTTWYGPVTSNKHKMQSWCYPEHASSQIHLQTGDELGHFQLGSSVIVLFSKNSINWQTNCYTNNNIYMGQTIACKQQSQ